MLNKKQNIKDNSEWIEAFKTCTDIYSKADINTLAEQTTADIRQITKPYGNVCSGWIAGKDSIVLEDILRKSGIKYTPIMWRGINEYPAMKEWIDKNKPSNLIEEVIRK